jgi:hypothetical protein
VDGRSAWQQPEKAQRKFLLDRMQLAEQFLAIDLVHVHP